MANAWERVYDPVRENTISYGPVQSGRFNVFRAGFYLGFVERSTPVSRITPQFRVYSARYPGQLQVVMSVTDAVFHEFIEKHKTLVWTELSESIDTERRRREYWRNV